MTRMWMVLSALPSTFALEFEPGALVALEVRSPEGAVTPLALPGVRYPPAGPGGLRIRLTATADGLDLLVLPPGEAGVTSRFALPLAVGHAVGVVVVDPAAPPVQPSGPPPATEPVDLEPGYRRGGADAGPKRRRDPRGPAIAPPSGRACPRHGISPPEACPLCR